MDHDEVERVKEQTAARIRYMRDEQPLYYMQLTEHMNDDETRKQFALMTAAAVGTGPAALMVMADDEFCEQLKRLCNSAFTLGYIAAIEDGHGQ